MAQLSLKNLITIFGVFLLFSSCMNMQTEKRLIADYEQNFDGTITDLSLKILKIERLRAILASDSLIIAREYLETKRASKIQEFKIYINSDMESIRDYESKLANRKNLYDFEIKSYEDNIAAKEKSIKNWEASILNYEGTCKDTFLEETYKNVQNYEANLGEILAYEYKVTYSIKNPFLNNVKQTLTKNYFFDGGLTKIILVGN